MKYTFKLKEGAVTPSFGSGEVTANNLDQARALAYKELTQKFDKANKAFNNSLHGSSLGFRLEFNAELIEVEPAPLKIWKVKYRDGGHGNRASDVLFTLEVSFEDLSIPILMLYGYESADQNIYIFNTLIDCFNHYNNLRSGFHSEIMNTNVIEMEQILEQEEVGYTLLETYINKLN